jgi:hypothetical protein
VSVGAEGPRRLSLPKRRRWDSQAAGRLASHLISLTPLSALAIASAGLAAGTINTVVGSGTLITFPVLLGLGYPALVANVSNNIGLVLGNVSGSVAYRRELGGQRRRATILGTMSLLGGLAGALLLLALPGSSFRRVVPYLILVGCALVALQPRASRWLSKHHAERGRPRSTRLALMATVLATGIYGGYFGAAQGVILISLLGIFVADGLQRLNALKNVLVLITNLVAGVIFAFSGHVSWAVAGLLAIGAAAGGQIGGRFGRRLPQPVLRAVIVVVGVVVAAVLLA